MKYILSILTVILLSGAPIALAHETGVAHEEPGALAKRTGNVSPAAVGIFGVAILGAGGYFMWIKRKKNSDSKPENMDKTPKV